MVSCPQCQSDSFLNPNIKILLSPCYHKICTTCLQRLFPLGNGNCPECGVPLRKSNFFQSTFEDVNIERECQIRKKLFLNKKKEIDFNSKLEYFNYLEKLEDKVFFVLSLNPLETKKFLLNENNSLLKNKVDIGKRKRTKLFQNMYSEKNDNELVFKFIPIIIKKNSFDFNNVNIPYCFKIKGYGSLTDQDIMQMAIDLIL